MISTNVSGTLRNAFASHVCRARPNPQRSPIRNVKPPKAQMASTRPTMIAESAPHLQQREGMVLTIASSQVMTEVMSAQMSRDNVAVTTSRRLLRRAGRAPG